MRGALEILRQVRAEPGGRERLVPVWFYLFRVSDLDLQAVHDLLDADVDHEIRDDMKTTADRIEEEARAKFMATTAPRIRGEERAATLLRQIERRFGAPDETTRTRVQQAAHDELDRWLDAILDAPTLDDLLAS